MALRGEKTATKDIDIVLNSKSEFNILIQTLRGMGFYENTRLERSYKRMQARVMVHPKGLWLDTFLNSLCDSYYIHDEIMQRALPYFNEGNLKVYLMSREDIFIAKSITERDGDLDDMYQLYIRGLEPDVIMTELEWQTSRSGKNFIWEAFMAARLEELEAHADLTIPFKNKIMTKAEEIMEKRLLH